MKLGDKPIAEMTHSEMVEAITFLRDKREALLEDARNRKRASVEAQIPSESKEKKTRMPKAIDPFLADTLAFLRGDKEDL